MNFKRVIAVLVLIIVGYMVTTLIFNDEPERVVVFEGESNRVPHEIIPASQMQGGDLPSMAAFNEAFVKIAKKVSPSVVTITAEKVIKTESIPRFPGFDDEFFERFFGMPSPRREMRTTALGSGVIVDKKGYILTNYHVVAKGEKIHVELIDEKEYEGEIIGTDQRSDLAVIKIDPDEELTPAVLGDSEQLQVGEWVVAIGSPLSSNLANTVTAGIVSAKGRSQIVQQNRYESFIQTDAAINPGNSGGALVNMYGELIGINTAIATSGAMRGNIGIGFAIPINLAKRIMTDLIEKGKVVRAWLGVYIQDIDDRFAEALDLKTRKGALISDVVAESPADQAGLQRQDVVIEFNDTEVKDAGHLQYLVGNSDIGEKVELTIVRDGKEKKITVELVEMPEEQEMATATEAESGSELGVTVRDLTPALAKEFGYDPDEAGVLVVELERGTEAAEKLQRGDIIKRIGNVIIKDVNDYQQALQNIKKDVILMLVKRGKNTFFITLERVK